MHEVLEKFQKIGIIPVVKIDRAEDAAPLAKALCDGGLPVAEVTFRTAAAKDAIAAMTAAYPDMLVGAGTVLTVQQVDDAVSAGAQFIVSPGLNPKVVRHCQEIGVPITPGVTSPTEIEQALELGLEVVKFFPAEASGGLAKIKAMSAPYGNILFMPTGGIHAANLNSYLEFPKILACGGSWMVSSELINRGDFEQITALTKEAIREMLGFKIKHIGINPCDADALTTANLFEDTFGFTKKETPISYFCDSYIEVMKEPGEGTKGHIGIQTNYMERAIYYLEQRGYHFRKDTSMWDEKGKLKLIYLEGEYDGFAVHLCKK